MVMSHSGACQYACLITAFCSQPDEFRSAEVADQVAAYYKQNTRSNLSKYICFMFI